MLGAKIIKLPVSFFVTEASPFVQKAVEKLLEENTKYEFQTSWETNRVTGMKTKNTVRLPVARFACQTVNKLNTGFLIKDLERFIQLCYEFGVNRDKLVIVEPKKYEPVKCDFGLKGFTPREKQKPALAHLSRSGERQKSVLVSATGTGKTVMAIYHMTQQGVRTMFSMNPSHIETWRSEIRVFTNVTDDEIYHFSGGESIRKAIELVKEGKFNYKIILTSAVTIRNFLKEYEEEGADNSSYGVTPLQLWEYFGIGLVVRDEVHEAIHTLVKQSIYCAAPETVYLSATLAPDDNFLKGIYEKVFPQEVRWYSENNKYLMMHPLFYSMEKQISGNSFRGYSHAAYEKRLLKKKKVLDRYMNLIRYTVDLWKKEYKPGKKLMIIASMVEMCEHILKVVREYVPEYDSNVFVEGSPKSNLYESTIVIGTPGRIGTGVNIPNLSMVVLTVALGSQQRSIQIAGRPREIKLYPEDTPRFIYFVNAGNKSHVKYHQKRLVYMASRIKGRADINTGYRV